MKTRIVIIVTLFVTMVICGPDTYASRPTTDSTKDASIIQAKQLIMRLDTINASDKSNFNKAEKKILRKEVRFIKRDLKELRGGRYLSTMLIVMIVLIPVSVFQLTE